MVSHPEFTGEVRLESEAVVFCSCGQSFRIVLRVTPTENHRPSIEGGPRLAHTAEISEMQLKVLSFVAEGLTDREIARRVKCTIHQVKRAIRGSLARLSARNRTEAVMVARAAGLLDPSVGATNHAFDSRPEVEGQA